MYSQERSFRNRRINPAVALICTASVAALFGFFIVKAAKDFDPTYLVDLDTITDTELREEARIQFGR
jgi:hypothetical protein